MKRVSDTVQLGARTLEILRPPDAAGLIDEDEFARDEFLPYWAEPWPSGAALARAAEQLVRPGERVVELGCGLGVASIAAALAGARVLATDWAADALAFTAENAALNGASVETALVRWSEPEALLDGAPWDWVLAADVLYEHRNVAPLLDLLPSLGGRALLADPGRPAARTFVDGLPGWSSEQLEPDPALVRGAVWILRRG
ncbi:MAG: class I SAM-dependent methyltransferase [Solirubrobacteraceae bacterium]